MLQLRYIFSLVLLCCVLAADAGSVAITGAKLPVQEVVPDKSTGLDKIFVSYDMDGVSLVYTATGSGNVTFYSYRSLGGGYAQELTNVTGSGNTYTLAAPQRDMGYIIEEGTDRYYLWLVNYSAHRLNLKGVTIPDDQDCNLTRLQLQGSGSPIHFYSINGRQYTLDQESKVDYFTLEYDEENKQYDQVTTTQNLEGFSESVYINPAPLCNTTFRITGDRFLEAWHWGESVESPNFRTNAVDAHTYAEQLPESTDEDYKSNQIGSSSSGDELGGSAPADITFTAICSDAVIHHEWQFSKSPDFENLLYRFNEREVNYVFREEGTTYVRYIGSNAEGTCETEGETFTVSIGSSDLKCPNAFSPGASEGVNDEWKVLYRSIVDFKCWIFNRHGRQLFYFTDPSQGWDGKVGGKVVSSGVYYYVIDATGADGKHYKLSGDINVIGYKRNFSTSGGSSEPAE